MIIVENTGTADDADFLDATDLANIPSAGVLTVYASSTQDDTLITITGPGSEPVVRSQAILLRANGEIRANEDVPYVVPVFQGGHYIVDVNVQTAATYRVRCVYQDAAELGLVS